MAPTVEPTVTDPGNAQSFLDGWIEWILRFTPWGETRGADPEGEHPSDEDGGETIAGIDPLGHRPGKG